MKKNNLQKLLEKGTPRQKALFVCKEWVEPNNIRRYGGKPTLTAEEVEYIQTSLKTDRERREYNKWTGVYNKFIKIQPTLGLGIAEYYRAANRLVSFLYLWEAYEQEEDTINTALLAVRESGSEEALDSLVKAIEKRETCIRQAEITRDEEGYFCIDVFREGGLYGRIERTKKQVRDAYVALKALVIALEEYVEETKSEDFLFDIFKTSIEGIKSGYRAFDVSPRYSCKELRIWKENGGKTTETDEKRAVFPEYEELEVDPEHLELFRERIKYT